MGRVTRRKVYSSNPDDIVSEVATPSKTKRRHYSSTATTSTPKASQAKTLSLETQKSPPFTYRQKVNTSYPDDGFPLSQAPCEVMWDSRNNVTGCGGKITDILNSLKNEPVDCFGLEAMPSTPPLVEFTRPQSPECRANLNIRRKVRRVRKVRQKLPRTAPSLDCLLLDKLQELTNSKPETNEKADEVVTSKRMTRSQTVAVSGLGTMADKDKGDQSYSDLLEESFDLFPSQHTEKLGPKSSSRPVSTSPMVNPLASPPLVNGSTEELWNNDDFCDDSFMLATQTLMNANEFVSPKCPPRKRQLCRTPESVAPEKRFTFTLDSDVSKNVLGCVMATSTITSSPTASTSTMLDSSVVPQQSNNQRDNGNIKVIKATTSIVSNKQLGTESMAINNHVQNGSVPFIQSKAPTPATIDSTSEIYVSNNDFPRNGLIRPVGAYQPDPKVAQALVQQSGQPEARCRHPEPTFRQPDPHFKQPKPGFRRPDPIFRQPDPKFRELDHRLKQAGAKPLAPKFRHPKSQLSHVGSDSGTTSRLSESTGNLQTSAGQPPVISAAGTSNMSADSSVIWSTSQIGATSTQINLKVVPISTADTPSVIKNRGRHSTDENTVKSAQVILASTVKMSMVGAGQKSSKPLCDVAMDMSLSDDLLAELAEPDDLLDSQACLALLNTTGKPPSQTSRDHLGDEPKSNPRLGAGSLEPDYLDCLLLDPKPGKSAPGKSSKQPDESFLDDDCDFMLQTALEEVELRLSQEEKKSSNKPCKRGTSTLTNQPGNILAKTSDVSKISSSNKPTTHLLHSTAISSNHSIISNRSLEISNKHTSTSHRHTNCSIISTIKPGMSGGANISAATTNPTNSCISVNKFPGVPKTSPGGRSITKLGSTGVVPHAVVLQSNLKTTNITTEPSTTVACSAISQFVGQQPVTRSLRRVQSFSIGCMEQNNKTATSTCLMPTNVQSSNISVDAQPSVQCMKDEIEKKRQEALKRRQSKLKLARHVSTIF